MFSPRLALASLSGESDATWARRGLPHAGCAFLGGIALDEPTRDAARQLVARDRDEFLPDDPISFCNVQLGSLASARLRPGLNVRSATPAPVGAAADVCASHGAILEVNAHCRQDEMCAAGAGETLLRETDRLCEQVRAAAATGATVSVKVRAELDGVDLVAMARRIEAAGAAAIHVDAMDSDRVVGGIADGSNLFVIANNGVRDVATARAYLATGADAVSVGRASDRPAVLRTVRGAVDDWFDGDRTTGAVEGEARP